MILHLLLFQSLITNNQLKLLIILLSISFFHNYANCQDDFVKTFLHFRPTKSIYYDPSNSQLLKIGAIDSQPSPGHLLKFESNFNGCTCTNLTCGCCAGIKVDFIRFDRKICGNLTIVPRQLALEFAIFADNQEVIRQKLSAHNPPPVCVPLYFLPIIDFCARIHDLGIIENKLNACIDFETRIVSHPIFILHFDCIQIGTTGINWVKPDDVNFFEPNPIFSGLTPPRPTLLFTPDVTEIYDEVFHDPEEAQIVDVNNSNTELSDDEAQIGTLKS